MLFKNILEVHTPKLNNNEEYVTLIEVVDNYVQLKKGDIIGVVESTKTAVEVTAPANGYLYCAHSVGSQVPVGEVLVLLLENKDTDISKYNITSETERIISKSALQLLNEHNVDIQDVPGHGAISEKDVQLILSNKAEDLQLTKVMENSLLIYCAGDHAEVIYEVVTAANDYDVIGFVDYSGVPKRKDIFGIKVYSKFDLFRLLDAGIVNVHVNTNSFQETLRVAGIIKSHGGNLASIIHPSAVISNTSKLEDNVFVGANAVVGTQAKIGQFSKVLNGASVAHHSTIGQNCQISDGARIAGSVVIGSHCIVGLNSTVNMKLKVTNNVTIASGVNVYTDITKKGLLTL